MDTDQTKSDKAGVVVSCPLAPVFGGEGEGAEFQNDALLKTFAPRGETKRE